MEYKNVYFLGIGGIGMSALARYFLHEGRRVAGYDRTRSHLTEELEAEVGELYLRGLPRDGAVPLDNKDGLPFEGEAARGHNNELVLREVSALFAYRAKLTEKIPEYAACFF